MIRTNRIRMISQNSRSSTHIVPMSTRVREYEAERGTFGDKAAPGAYSNRCPPYRKRRNSYHCDRHRVLGPTC